MTEWFGSCLKPDWLSYYLHAKYILFDLIFFSYLHKIAMNIPVERDGMIGGVKWVFDTQKGMAEVRWAQSSQPELGGK